MFVNIGCQVSLRNRGWISLDLYGSPDIVSDAFDVKLDNNSCDMIVASHVLEHYPFVGTGEDRIATTINVLKNWKSKLKPEGKLIICLPDGDMIVEKIYKDRLNYWKFTDTDYVGPIFGNISPDNQHHMLYTYGCIEYCLKEAGFTNIKRIPNSNIPLPEINVSSQDIRSMNVEVS